MVGLHAQTQYGIHYPFGSMSFNGDPTITNNSNGKREMEGMWNEKQIVNVREAFESRN